MSWLILTMGDAIKIPQSSIKPCNKMPNHHLLRGFSFTRWLIVLLFKEIRARLLLIATITAAAATVPPNGEAPTITLTSTALIIITIIVSKADFYQKGTWHPA